MKIHIKTLVGKTADIEIDEKTATIGELRSKISRALLVADTPDNLERSINDIGYINLKDNLGNIITIYHDDPSDTNLKPFLISQKPEFKIEEIIAFLVINLGPTHCRPTKHNPRGVALYAFDEKEKQSVFFKSITNPDSNQSFRKRLEQIQFNGDIPESFLDPITELLMNNPLITSDTHTYDEETIRKLKNVSPYTKKPFKEIEYNLLLRSQIEDFVSEQERLSLNHHPLKSNKM